MIVKYALLNALTFTATYQLFCLINCIFTTAILPNTKYFVNKLFYPKKWSTFHGICPHCNDYAGSYVPHKDRYLTCKMCKVKINVNKYNFKDFFVTMDPSSPIKQLIESNATYYDFVIKDRPHEKGLIRDIYDGKMYRDFKKSLNASDKYQYATVSFKTDGVPLFENSTSSIWPIYIMINEIPFNIRTKELVLAGIWVGADKPNMNIFLEPFVNIMNDLSINRIPCTINEDKRYIKIFPLVCCVDSVARPPAQGFVQFNAYNGCNMCLHNGEYIRNSLNPRSKGCVKYYKRC